MNSKNTNVILKFDIKRRKMYNIKYLVSVLLYYNKERQFMGYYEKAYKNEMRYCDEKVDLIEFLYNCGSLETAIYMLEDKGIEIDRSNIDDVKLAVMSFLHHAMTQEALSAGGYVALRDSMVRVLKGEDLLTVLCSLDARTSEEMAYTISELGFDYTMSCFDGINFNPESNPNLAEEFIEEAVYYVGRKL